MELFDRYDVTPETAWIGTLLAGLLVVSGAALAFTERVYYGFLWRYLWGPVRADAEGANCLAYSRDRGEILTEAEAIDAGYFQECARVDSVYLAEPGYTVISTLTYILILVFMLAGVYLLLDRFDLAPYDRFLYALVPFMLFGGALRTVEDSFVAAQNAGEVPAIEFPASALLISPFIYFTVFAIALLSLLVAKWLVHTGRTETFYYPLGIAGVGWLAVAFGYTLSRAFIDDWVALHPSILLLTLGLATALAVGVYLGIERVRPAINAGTGLVGLVVLWGHAIDGVANVLANDWTHLWNLGEYDAKHPFNQLVMDVTNTIQGGESIAGVYVGDAWPFLIVKLLVPVAIIAVFDEEFMEDSPRYAIMLLGAIIAVGLGPGTRDMLRITFGI